MKWSQSDIDRFNARKEKPPERVRSASKNGVQALGRMKAGKMNKTEALYKELLERQKIAGEILDYWFEAVNLRIGENCFYKPDFLVMKKDGLLELHECKGWMTDDALVKIRAIVEKYPFPLKVVRLVKGRWEEKYY